MHKPRYTLIIGTDGGIVYWGKLVSLELDNRIFESERIENTSMEYDSTTCVVWNSYFRIFKKLSKTWVMYIGTNNEKRKKKSVETSSPLYQYQTYTQIIA